MTLPNTAATLRQMADELQAGAAMPGARQTLQDAADEIDELRAELIAVRARGFTAAPPIDSGGAYYLQERRA